MDRHQFGIFFNAFVFAMIVVSEASGQGRPHKHADRLHSVGSTNCHSAADPSDIRLWDGDAPGAVGNDPCRDIPFLRVYAAPTLDIKPAVLIVPVGGYDHLSDLKEQEPVA